MRQCCQRRQTLLLLLKNISKPFQNMRNILMHVEFVPGGEDTLKHCLQHDKLLKISTDGSFNQ
jgi:hypothetical protein